MSISVCIATYRRPARLRALLGDLAQQRVLPGEVVVVDNDAAQSGRAAVDRARSGGTPFPVRYAVEPRKNVSHARNRSVAIAQLPWLAFIDDDERAPPGWLEALSQTVERHGADGVLGPVEPQLPAAAPDWLRRGQFYAWPHLATGTQVPPRLLRFGNVLLRAELLRPSGRNGGRPEPFDPAYGTTGGEDGDLLTRLTQEGARLVWCEDARVHEPVEPARLSLRWLMLRSLRGGQDFARHVLAGRHGAPTLLRRAALFVRAAVQLLAALALAAATLPLGRHVAARWLTKACANAGKLTVFFGWHYREYA